MPLESGAGKSPSGPLEPKVYLKVKLTMTMKRGSGLVSGTYLKVPYVQCFPVCDHTIPYAHQYSLFSIPDPISDRNHSQLIGVCYIDIMNFIAFLAELKGAYLIAVSIAFTPSSIRFLKRELRNDSSNWPHNTT